MAEVGSLLFLCTVVDVEGSVSLQGQKEEFFETDSDNFFFSIVPLIVS